jgi:hypothetical protein
MSTPYFRPSEPTNEMIAAQGLPFVNQTTEIAKAAAAGAAAAAATGRLSAGVDILGPVVMVYDLDGQPVIVPRPPLGNAPDRAGQLVPNDELEAMGQEVERWPVCEVPSCHGEGRYQILSSAGRPLSINRKSELVLGDLKPMHEEKMTANDRARARAGLTGVIGPSGVAPAQLAVKSFVNVCLDHQFLEAAPYKSPKRYVSGPCSGLFKASERADQVAGRTGRAPTVDSVKVNGTEVFYVIGDDGSDGYQGKLTAL